MARLPRRVRRVPRLLAALAVLMSLLAVAPPAAIAAGSSVVTNCLDTLSPATPGSLRAAIEDANADSEATALDPHVITFALDPPCDLITLAGQQLRLSNHVDVQGPGAGALTVDADDLSRVFDVVSGVTATISGLTITGGNGTPGGSFGAEGGGIRNRGSLTVRAVVIIGNAATWGAGIDSSGQGHLAIESSTLTGNTATSGGGALWSGSNATITNSTISDNGANWAAIQAEGAITVALVSSTLADNTATGLNQINVSGLYVVSSAILTISRSIVADRFGQPNCLTRLGGVIVSLGYNLEDANTCGLDPDLGDIPDGNPDLLPLADYGGPTPTHALGPNSAARDHIPAADCELTTDQRGVDRPFPADGQCDIGAFEDTNAGPTGASLTINGGAQWTNDPNVTLDFAATDDVGIVSYALAETQAGLDTATPNAVDPAEADFSRDDVAFELSAGDDSSREIWVRVCDAQRFCADASDTIGLDTTGPVVTPPADMTVSSPDGNPVVVEYPDATADDALSGVADGWPQCAPASGSAFPLGTTQVECEAYDTLGNWGSATFTVNVVRDWVQGCLYAGSLSQVSVVGYGDAPTASCARGEVIVLEQGDDLFGCLYAGSLSQVGTTEPVNCGRGMPVELAAGDDLHGCLYAGRLSQVGDDAPASCGRGEQVGLARAMN